MAHAYLGSKKTALSSLNCVESLRSIEGGAPEESDVAIPYLTFKALMLLDRYNFPKIIVALLLRLARMESYMMQVQSTVWHCAE